MLQSESIFPPITKEAIRQAKSRLLAAGFDTIQDWAEAHEFDARLVTAVLSGRRRAIRGNSLKIARRLGLRPDPSAAAQVASPSPAGHTVAGGPSVASCDRRPKLQDVVGEAAR